MVSTRSSSLKAIELPVPYRFLAPRANTWTPNQTEDGSTATPAQNSRLLALPAELRARIWEYVLGGNTLHIVRSKNSHLFGSSMKTTLCVASISDHEAAVAMRQDPPNTAIPRHRERHSDCVYDRDGLHTRAHRVPRLSVSILRTCRQLHQEAALIPFANNDFSVSDPRELSGLPMMLSPMQQQAMRRLILCPPRFYSSSPVSPKHVANIKQVLVLYEEARRRIRTNSQSGRQFLCLHFPTRFPALEEAIIAVHPTLNAVTASIVEFSEQRLLQQLDIGPLDRL